MNANIQTQKLIASLERRMAFHQGNQNDPHNVGQAVSIALLEVRNAVRYSVGELPADAAPEPPTNEDLEWVEKWVEKDIIRTLPWPTKILIKDAIMSALAHERSKPK